MGSKREANKINAVTDVTDTFYISVTCARVRAYTGYKGEPVTSVTTRKTAVLALDLGAAAGWAMRLADGAIAILLCAAGPWGCVR